MAYFNPLIENYLKRGEEAKIGLSHSGHSPSVGAGVNPINISCLSYNLAGKK